MPQVLPPVRLFSMKAGKKLFIQLFSSPFLANSSNGTTASSSISENMSVDRSTQMTGGLPDLCAVSALTIVSW
jgi:hypothetical protein